MEIIKLTPQLWQTLEISELSKALISFAQDFQKASLKKDAKNPHLRNKYVSLDGLLNTVRPILTKHKLAITQDLSVEGIEHRINVSTGHRVTIYTAATTVLSDLILDDITYGVLSTTNALA